MQNAWPRNIVPYTEEKLRALSTVANVRFYLALLETPRAESELHADERATAHELMQAGLVARHDGKLVPTDRHRRDPDGDVPGVVEHKRANVEFVHTILDDTLDALDAKGHRAKAAIGVVTLPDRPEVIARATAIMAEAEDLLHALAEEEPTAKGDPAVRVVVYLGSVQ